MTAISPGAESLDSFEKMTMAFIERFGSSFLKRVNPDDYVDVAVAFVTYVTPYLNDNADHFRVMPVGMKDEYRLAAGCCASFDTVIKASSGRVYMAGFNYGH